MIFSDKDSQWCRAISDMAQLPGLPIRGGRTKTMKTWLVKLTVDIVAHVKTPDDWPEDAAGALALEAISLFPMTTGVATLKVQNVMVDGIVEIHKS